MTELCKVLKWINAYNYEMIASLEEGGGDTPTIAFFRGMNNILGAFVTALGVVKNLLDWPQVSNKEENNNATQDDAILRQDQ